MAKRGSLPAVSPDVLSPTELKVARLLVLGRPAGEIARHVNGLKTVESYRQTIYEKLGISDRVTLIRWVMRYASDGDDALGESPARPDEGESDSQTCQTG